MRSSEVLNNLNSIAVPEEFKRPLRAGEFEL